MSEVIENNKCQANDNILNEFLKYSSEKMLSIYVAFFTLVLDTGIIPGSWLEGVIRPIHIRSGDPQNTEN